MARQERVAAAIKRQVSQILHDELKDPRLGFVTVTRVEVTPDLRFARIFFSVLGKDEDYKRTREALDSALGFIRKLVSERINLRFSPEIAFREDRSAEYNIKIEEVLNEIKEEQEQRQKQQLKTTPLGQRGDGHKRDSRKHKGK